MKVVSCIIAVLIALAYLKYHQNDPPIEDDTLNYLESLPRLKQIHERNILKLISNKIDLDPTKKESGFLAAQKDLQKNQNHTNNQKLKLGY